MNKKQEFCNWLISEQLVKPYEVIRHNYTTYRKSTGGGIKSINICPTLDTRCDCLGVVVPYR